MSPQDELVKSELDMDKLPFGSKVCLYGAGLGGGNFKELIETSRRDMELLYFIDDYKRGRKQGIEILSPKDLPALKQDFKVLIVSAYWKKMQETLNRLGIDNYKIVNPYLYLGFQIFTKAEEEEYAPSFKNVKGLLHYEQDRSLYDLLIENRKIEQKIVDNPNEHFLRHLNRPSQEYLDFINKERIHTVIEGGVFDGESTVDFLRLLPKDVFIYGFEPLYKAYVESRHQAFLDSLDNVRIYHLALWKNKCRLNLFENEENRADSSVFNRNGQKKNTKSVEAISLDEFVEENDIRKIDFIKLDVEGAELEILQGAKNTLIGHRPQLAVCIYHKKEHMFEIPLFLSNILKDYNYRIGHYSSSLWCTVWYAIPNEIKES